MCRTRNELGRVERKVQGFKLEAGAEMGRARGGIERKNTKRRSLDRSQCDLQAHIRPHPQIGPYAKGNGKGTRRLISGNA
jgi:hypothetical protein